MNTNSKNKTVRRIIKNGEHVQIDFSPGDLVIDCGANVGDISALFAVHGAAVIAYEPNIYAYKHLQNRFLNYKNVTCFQAGVYTEDSTKKLFLHENSKQNPLKYSTGCSIIEQKNNVDTNNSIDIKLVDLSRIIKQINNSYSKGVHVLKIDIEGAECDLIEKLMDEGLLRDIPYVFVETHEQKIPFLLEKTKKMLRRAQDLDLNNINFNWI
jgi:FkbM family methyltransferase